MHDVAGLNAQVQARSIPLTGWQQYNFFVVTTLKSESAPPFRKLGSLTVYTFHDCKLQITGARSSLLATAVPQRSHNGSDSHNVHIKMEKAYRLQEQRNHRGRCEREGWEVMSGILVRLVIGVIFQQRRCGRRG
jgi:hypothetical protein